MSGAVGSERRERDRDRVKSYQIVSKVAHAVFETFLSLLDHSRQHRDTMPVFVGQKHVLEYDPPPPPLTKEEQEKVDYEAYNEQQRVKFEIPSPQWKGKYRPKTTPKYEYVSVVPHYPTQPDTREEIVMRPLTEDEVRLRTDVDNFNKEQKALFYKDHPEERWKSSSRTTAPNWKNFGVELPKVLAPNEFLKRCNTALHSELHTNEVARKITKYSYPETDFQSTPRGMPVSLDICYHYNEDDNRVLQEFAEQGWELVSCVTVNYTKTFYFKRELELIPDTTNAD